MEVRYLLNRTDQDGQLQEPQERNRYWKTAGDKEPVETWRQEKLQVL